MAPHYAANKVYISDFIRFCERRDWRPAAVALAWVLAQGPHVLPIPGTRSSANLRDCLGALEITLTEADLAEIARILPAGFAHGARYSAAQFDGVENYC
jgi:aryl-alcohol dehydrogenase-like predicted oxidoreductase